MNIEDKIKHLCSLKEGWGQYSNGETIETKPSDVLDLYKILIPVVDNIDIFPGQDGTICMAFNYNNKRIIISVI